LHQWVTEVVLLLKEEMMIKEALKQLKQLKPIKFEKSRKNRKYTTKTSKWQIFRK